MQNDKIIVYGNFMHSKPGFGGQITKTRNVFNYLAEQYGIDNVIEFNMENWKKKPFSIVKKIICCFKKYRRLVILPGDNNLKFLLFLLKKNIRKYNLDIYYMVVGGWLFDYLKNRPSKIKVVSQFKGIFVETNELLENLKTLSLNNVYYSPVFSSRQIRTFENVKQDIENNKTLDLFKFCTFSRVLKEKGIEDASNAIFKLNNEYKIRCSLDIYGAIDDKYKNDFEQLLASNQFIHYKGFIDDDKVICTLCNYHAMIFATYYYGEGFPATLLEANMAGLPIIASNWKYNKEIVIDGQTGLLFKVNDIDDLCEKILKFINSDYCLGDMRICALNHSFNFTPNNALRPLFDKLSSDLVYEK